MFVHRSTGAKPASVVWSSNPIRATGWPVCSGCGPRSFSPTSAPADFIRGQHWNSTVNPPRPTTEQIRQRAYQLYCERGRTAGHEIDDWLQAEFELTQLPISQLAELKAGNNRTGSPLVGLVQMALFLGENI